MRTVNKSLHTNRDIGQIWTPVEIAKGMSYEALQAQPLPKRVLDPSCGPGTFPMALHQAGAKGVRITCYDVDKRMEKETRRKLREIGMKGEVVLQDYLSALSLSGKFDLVIMNPPYIRQELIPKDIKEVYCKYLSHSLNDVVDKRSNLFALFMLKGIIDLAPGGVLSTIVYNAVTQSGYGTKTMAIMNRHAELLSSKTIQAPFEGVMVDAQILLYRKRATPLPHQLNTIKNNNGNLVALSELLNIRRGTALPLRKVYIASPIDPFYEQSMPFFIKQAKLKGLVIVPDAKAYLENTPSITDNALESWLKVRANANNIVLGKVSVKPVCRPLAFNYYIRKKPRHLWNKESVALADNFYASSTKNGFPADAAWLLLNSDVYLDRLIESARNQGSGLLKLQVYEYKQTMVPDWRQLPIRSIHFLSSMASRLINEDASYESVRKTANKLTKGLIHA